LVFLHFCASICSWFSRWSFHFLMDLCFWKLIEGVWWRDLVFEWEFCDLKIWEKWRKNGVWWWSVQRRFCSLFCSLRALKLRSYL
jgi:hypothetical protein